VYFDIVCNASKDAGITVRKRAVKVLWDCCCATPDFPRAAEGIMHIMARGADVEGSMKAAVVKMCHQLWFTPGGSFAGAGGAGRRLLRPSCPPHFVCATPASWTGWAITP
jgi:hypothetical protein